MENKPLLDERDEKQALNALAEQDGGKIILASLRDDINRYINLLSHEYRTATHFDLVRTCADLNASLSLYRALTRAGKHVKEIDEIIKESLDE